MSKTKENKIYNINKRFKMYAAYDNIFEPIEMDISNLEISKETIYAREPFEGNSTKFSLHFPYKNEDNKSVGFDIKLLTSTSIEELIIDVTENDGNNKISSNRLYFKLDMQTIYMIQDYAVTIDEDLLYKAYYVEGLFHAITKIINENSIYNINMEDVE